MLENIELIENLEDSKRVSTEIAEKMVIAAETEKKINIPPPPSPPTRAHVQTSTR